MTAAIQRVSLTDCHTGAQLWWISKPHSYIVAQHASEHLGLSTERKILLSQVSLWGCQHCPFSDVPTASAPPFSSCTCVHFIRSKEIFYSPSYSLSLSQVSAFKM